LRQTEMQPVLLILTRFQDDTNYAIL